MQADGRGWLFVPSGLTDGPFPTHYEPHESPFRNPLYGQQANPAREQYHRRDNAYNPSDGQPGAEVFPYVMTTYRLTEHHTAGGMSRTLPYLAELQPEMFCEVSPALAAERGLEHGGWATIISARTAIEARVLVTERIEPLRVQGRVMHQVGLPYHWGQRGVSTGDSANDLFALALDPNVHIQEVKAATCDIRPGGARVAGRLTQLVEDYRRRAQRGCELRRRKRSPAWASSPTRRSASAARPARSPARNGTTCPTTPQGFTGESYDNSGALGRKHAGATSRSSSSASRWAM